jgi:hypothetical protein
MSQINPFTGSIVQAPNVQRTQAADKDRQLRRASDLAKNAALAGDQLQHEVESSEALTPTGDDQQRKPPKRKNPHSNLPAEDDDGESHLDVTA